MAGATAAGERGWRFAQACPYRCFGHGSKRFWSPWRCQIAVDARRRLDGPVSAAGCGDGGRGWVLGARVAAAVELRAEPGKTLRQVVEINNVSTAPSPLSVQTAEWRYGSDGSLLFDNALAEGSCRPWVAIEARELTLGSSARKRFRFEVAVPSDAPIQECRFALLFEGAPEAVGNLAVPVSGRIAVIVYVTVGGIAPRLDLERIGTSTTEGRRLPSVTVTNRGTGTTRLEGFVSGRDAQGRELVLVPQNFPVLPGQTRTIVLVPDVPGGEAAPVIAYPVKLSGRLEWAGESLKIDQRIDE